MLPGRRRNLMVNGTAWAALTAGLLCASPSIAQDSPVTLAQAAAPAVQPAANPERPPSEISSFAGSLIPGFQLGARVDLSETYTTNSYGYYTTGNNGDDLITQAGLFLDMHEHSRSVSIDASYGGQLYYYARDTQPVQFINDLQAVGQVIAIPDYLSFIGRAFAQPVVSSSSAFGSAYGIGSPNGYRNGYGYTVGPDITFRLGDFASSDTLATYSAAYFETPNGFDPTIVIPGVIGPQNTQIRSVQETLRSGEFFSRLQWTGVGTFMENESPQGLFSAKMGVVTFRYLIQRGFSLLGTGGYNALTNSIGFNRSISGPIAMGGVSYENENFSLEAQAGQRYNALSYEGTVRWNIGPTTAFTGVVTDGVNTPEGQLLSNLGGLTASLGGVLTNGSNIYANGSTASLTSFNLQQQGSLSFDQSVARYQRAVLTFLQDIERNHIALSAFAEKRTRLAGPIVGSDVSNSWGGYATYSRDVSRLTNASLYAGYTYYDELQGHSKFFNFGGQVGYSLSQQTSAYFRADYFKRETSPSFQSLSPITGGTDELRLTIGLSHRL